MLDISYPNCCLFHNVAYAESRVCVGRLTVVMPSVIILSVVASFANHDCSSAFAFAKAQQEQMEHKSFSIPAALFTTFLRPYF
jgi:hypothetical protein